MSNLTNWDIVHRYRRLAAEGKVAQLVCPDCDVPLTTRLDNDDEPILWCYSCLGSIKPGLDLFDNLRAVVTEHYV